MAWLNGILLKQCLGWQDTGSPCSDLPSFFRGNCRHWKEIEKNETLAKLFPEPPVVAFRQPKSIKDTLVRAALFRKVTSVSIHSFVEWLDTFSYVLQPADVTVKEVNHIRCFAIDIDEKCND
jgi:hypothetical protein